MIYEPEIQILTFQEWLLSMTNIGNGVEEGSREHHPVALATKEILDGKVDGDYIVHAWNMDNPKGYVKVRVYSDYPTKVAGEFYVPCGAKAVRPRMIRFYST